jgi:hypothetical protein
MSRDDMLSNILDHFFKNNCTCIKKKCNIQIPKFENDNPVKTSPLVLLDKMMDIKESFDESSCNIISLRESRITSQTFDSSIKNRLSRIDNLKYSLLFEKYLENNDIISKSTGGIKLFNGKLLSWENIGEINDNDVKKYYKDNIKTQSRWVSIYNKFTGSDQTVLDGSNYSTCVLIFKILLWYFRKSFIDNLLKDIVSEYMLDIAIYSIGSTKITSDYDITIYGNYNHIAYCISVFESTFQYFFTNKSAIVFDTNIYGASFIMFDLNELYEHSPDSLKKISIDTPILSTTEMSSNIPNIFKKHTCESIDFSYLKDSIDIVDYQHVWLFLKLLSYIHKTNSEYGINNDSIGEDFFAKSLLFKSIWSLEDSRIRKYLEKAIDIFPILMEIKRNTSYSYIVNKLNEYNTIKDKSNFISLVNFMGHETYFTRGAFIKTVINNQVCSNKSRVQLTVDALVDSAIENLFDFFFTYKLKYLERSIDSIKEIQIDDCGKIFKDCDFTEVYVRFNILESMTRNCKDSCDFTSMIPLITSIIKLLSINFSYKNVDFQDFRDLVKTRQKVDLDNSESERKGERKDESEGDSESEMSSIITSE